MGMCGASALQLRRLEDNGAIHCLARVATELNPYSTDYVPVPGDARHCPYTDSYGPPVTQTRAMRASPTSRLSSLALEFSVHDLGFGDLFEQFARLLGLVHAGGDVSLRDDSDQLSGLIYDRHAAHLIRFH